MYEDFYGFKEKPFNVTPNPKFFFPSQRHTEALDRLLYTINEKRGFAVITGEIGSGKTTVCRTLLSRLDTATKVAMITNTRLTPKQMLVSILEGLGVCLNSGTKPGLLSALNKFLLEQLSLDFNVVLIIDEAQNLSPTVLEEVRMLSNLETEEEKLIQIILMGQPELRAKLALNELAQLKQRISVQYHISPLSRDEMAGYINHRLGIASSNASIHVIFTGEALDEIYACSGGLPRVINMVCDDALLIGYAEETKEITPQIIEAVEDEFGKN